MEAGSIRGGIPPAAPLPVDAPSPGGGTSSPGRFPALLEGLLRDADALQKEADRAVAGLATGEVEDVHDVVVALARADLSFRMVLEVRNRVLEAYQEIMRTPV